MMTMIYYILGLVGLDGLGLECGVRGSKSSGQRKIEEDEKSQMRSEAKEEQKSNAAAVCKSTIGQDGLRDGPGAKVVSRQVNSAQHTLRNFFNQGNVHPKAWAWTMNGKLVLDTRTLDVKEVEQMEMQM